MNNQIDHDDFLNSYLIKEIGNNEFRIRVDLETRITGVKEFIISRNDFFIDCFDYTIPVRNYQDFNDILESTKFQLLDEEYDPYKIRKILKYLENIEDAVTSIIEFYRKSE